MANTNPTFTTLTDVILDKMKTSSEDEKQEWISVLKRIEKIKSKLKDKCIEDK